MKFSSVIALLLLTLLVGNALAVGPGKVLEFSKSSMGKVTFSGQIHKDAGFACNACHKPDLFPKMKQGAVAISMNEIYAGKLCGSCHNGKVAFDAKGNCNRCHKK
ncbi:MAG: cytochrome C [Desulfuromonadales bacterium GWD2_61_12]|nr:MAG: cytochrome C [Desulfuromonadales bacterium GWC2_61_20]OGR33701.1 MAG: cytochrome C [Desulfuromonadales bacterium GWD2_61_12]HAD04084.1 cytochrome C [Desulfuromonas sp.]HBT83731.1 cytochrome C [Desulfuromonas sp.]